MFTCLTGSILAKVSPAGNRSSPVLLGSFEASIDRYLQRLLTADSLAAVFED
jgi:hypothetical protein